MMSVGYAANLRRELCCLNAEFAKAHNLDHAFSYGDPPVVVYRPQPERASHGNFFQPSYAAILKSSAWACRLKKVHSQARRALPHAEHGWRELDSCTSSDALLMNIFCCRGVCGRRAVSSLLGTDPNDSPVFGYKACVPLLNGRVDRTEIDMRLGKLLVEAKLTETDFQMKRSTVLECYRDFKTVFDVAALPRSGDSFLSYQLIRNVLAAHDSGLSFCVILDERRGDLKEAWHAIMRCIRQAELWTRCKVLTWQELASALPVRLCDFLEEKYGIAMVMTGNHSKIHQSD